MSQAGRLAQIHRYPVKSIGGEALDQVALTPAQPLPGDRRFAVIHADGLRHLEDGALARWLPKAAFVRGVAAAPLQAVRGGWDGSDLVLTHPERLGLRFDPAQDDSALVEWLGPLWAAADKAPAVRLVEGPQALTDKNHPWLSILSLSSLRDLEGRLSRPLGVHRWRANLWIDGWEPYAERDMQLHRIRIGETVVLNLTQRIGRCAATSVDTDTGQIDVDMPKVLQDQFWHQDFGIYAEVEAGGIIRPGDEVEVL